MSVRRHEQQTRTSDSGHGVLGVWLPFCGAGSVETYGGGILVVVEGDAAIPGVFGPQRGVPPGWVPCFCWLKQEEDEEEPTTVQKHSREGYNIAALLFFFLFFLAMLGETRGGGPVWDVESGGTVCVLVADCQRPQSRARLKP